MGWGWHPQSVQVFYQILNNETNLVFMLYIQEWASWGVKHLCLATVDFNNAPPQEMLDKGVSFIEDMQSEDSTVYVHCKAGRGRSATLVACYLIKVNQDMAVQF